MSGYALDLARLRPDVRSAVLDLVESERSAAWLAGWDAAMIEATGVRPLTDDEHRALWRRVAAGTDLPTLLDRRGEHERAERLRAEYRRRGILDPVREAS